MCPKQQIYRATAEKSGFAIGDRCLPFRTGNSAYLRNMEFLNDLLRFFIRIEFVWPWEFFFEMSKEPSILLRGQSHVPFYPSFFSSWKTTKFCS